MKYYCKNCESEWTVSKEHDWFSMGYCPICKTSSSILIPDYETPTQYEARTGKPFPNHGVVWIGQSYISDWEGKEKKTGWLQTNFDIAKKVKAEGKDLQIVIASPPVPPPDDFVPTKAMGEL